MSISTPWLAKIQNGFEIAPSRRVGDFVTAKAPEFNKVQQISTSEPQTIQQESLRIHRVLQSSTRFSTWFGTRRPVVQIHSPRPFVSSHLVRLDLENLVLRQGGRAESLEKPCVLAERPAKGTYKICYISIGGAPACDFLGWLERTNSSPRKLICRKRIRTILGMPP
jgi:hypothetical protein